AAVRCPFTGEELTAVPALAPELAIVHAQRADRAGNVQLTGPVGMQREAVFAARRSLVTVDEVVETLPPGGIVLPGFAVSAVAEVPARATWGGAADRAGFTAWLAEVRA
uniref:CoA-transferase n=1 Tax=Pseudonocardia pini TaxID=2758030 RepID=UPI0024836B92